MNRPDETAPINVLLIDDRAADVRTLRETLVAGRIANRLHSIGNPHEAMAYLDRRGPYRRAPDVDLVILSANLAHDQAPWLLESIRRNERLSALAVIVLTDADADADAAAHAFRDAQAVLARPVGLTQLKTTLRTLKNVGAIYEHDTPQDTSGERGTEGGNND